MIEPARGPAAPSVVCGGAHVLDEHRGTKAARHSAVRMFERKSYSGDSPANSLALQALEVTEVLMNLVEGPRSPYPLGCLVHSHRTPSFRGVLRCRELGIRLTS